MKLLLLLCFRRKWALILIFQMQVSVDLCVPMLLLLCRCCECGYGADDASLQDHHMVHRPDPLLNADFATQCSNLLSEKKIMRHQFRRTDGKSKSILRTKIDFSKSNTTPVSICSCRVALSINFIYLFVTKKPSPDMA